MSDAVKIPDFNIVDRRARAERFSAARCGHERRRSARPNPARRRGRARHLFLRDRCGSASRRRFTDASAADRAARYAAGRNHGAHVVAIPATRPFWKRANFLCSTNSLPFPWSTRNDASIGVVDVSLFAEEMLEAGDREEERRSSRTSPMMFSKRSVSASRKSAALHRGGFFVTAFRGCSRRWRPAPPARCSPVRSKRRSPAVSSSPFFLRWCSG